MVRLVRNLFCLQGEVQKPIAAFRAPPIGWEGVIFQQNNGRVDFNILQAGRQEERKVNAGPGAPRSHWKESGDAANSR